VVCELTLLDGCGLGWVVSWHGWSGGLFGCWLAWMEVGWSVWRPGIDRVVCCVSSVSGLKKKKKEKKKKKKHFMSQRVRNAQGKKSFVFSSSLRIPDPYLGFESPRPRSALWGTWTSYQVAYKLTVWAPSTCLLPDWSSTCSPTNQPSTAQPCPLGTHRLVPP